MPIDRVREHFEGEAFQYDSLIPKLIPNYYEQNDLLLKMISFDNECRVKVLDLGCGTGILSYLILKSFPNAQVVAFDIAANMLEVCKNNLSTFSDRLTVKKGDFGRDNIGKNYDIVVSGLSTHHLTNEEKRKLYGHIFDALNPGGIFLNREIILGSTNNLTEFYHQQWCQYIKANGEDDKYWFNKYLEEDIPESVEKQLSWLKDVGFTDVGCHWKYLNFAIFGGRKG